MRTDFGGGSLRSQLVGMALRHSAKRVISAWSLAPRLPWPYFVVDHLGRTQRSVLGSTFERVDLPTCRGEVVRTPGSDSPRHVLYFHGGAFVIGGRLLHRALVSRIAHETRSTVTAVEYRKLPSHPISVSTADGVAAYRHLLEQGVPPQDIVLMGDSAGGFLAFTVADAALAAGLPAPAGIVALAPLVDFDLTRTPIDIGRRGCELFGRRSVPAFARLASRKEGGTAPRSPADCDHASLPPVLLQVSSTETLYSQVCALHDLLERAGVDVELQVWDSQVHVFQAVAGPPEAAEAIGEVAEFVERVAPVVRRKTA